MPTLEKITQTLTEHQYQDLDSPGLYPTQPTVCSCGTSPATRPDDGDYAWWVWHVATIADGRTPEGHRRTHDHSWTHVPGEKR